MVNERPTITSTYTVVDRVLAPGDNIYLAKTTTNVTADPSYIFLNINVIDPIITSSNYSVQDSVYRLYAYDSSMFVFV
ncbi:hypothetical protein C1645_838880 [Glomus cerebriforme]|uniref:Uncharacterized protein n=1 Tax=Glomus cerebriforme TaxID=658196 RepID=A0A397S1M9_9GLOM|nr:hypothetical protein C1645_838880 [Glomus cerebriforme]